MEADQEIAGSKQSSHLEQVRKTLGIEFEIEVAEVPDGGEFAWTVFWSLRRTGVVSYAEINAFQTATGVRLEAWEVEAIIAMDVTIAEWRAENARHS